MAIKFIVLRLIWDRAPTISIISGEILGLLVLGLRESLGLLELMRLSGLLFHIGRAANINVAQGLST